MVTRREFLFAAAGFVAFRNDTLARTERLLGKTDSDPFSCARDEDFWVQIQQAFALDRSMINLNNGGVCPSPRVVQDALRRQLEYGNQAPSYFMWQILEPEVESVRAQLAREFGVEKEEMAITRNASEALEICLFGFDLKPGDEILTTTLDYPRMLHTIRQRERREGVKMVQVRVPAVPSSHQEIVEVIEQGITSRTRLILICHVIFLNGQIFPVREICTMAKKRGIPVIVDGAHGFAHFPFSQEHLTCEYYGTSLHKWLMAPVGTGFLYVKKEKIKDLWPLMASAPEQDEDIRKFEEIGTHPAANHNAIAEALTFHQLIGGERKAERLRYLRDRWVEGVRDLPRVRFHTNLHPEHSCALATVEIVGIPAQDLARWFWEKHRIWVSAITHEDFQGIRITPQVYTTLQEIDRFVEVFRTAVREGIS